MEGELTMYLVDIENFVERLPHHESEHLSSLRKLLESQGGGTPSTPVLNSLIKQAGGANLGFWLACSVPMSTFYNQVEAAPKRPQDPSER